MKKIYWIIGIGIALILVIVIVKALNGAKQTKEMTEKVQKRTIVETVSANSRVQTETELKITSHASGKIVQMLVKEGDQVKKGVLLCRIKSDIYQSAID